ncbi:MAG: hypothetical protein U0556_15015 [Dehalococcoidia bacterium]
MRWFEHLHDRMIVYGSDQIECGALMMRDGRYCLNDRDLEERHIDRVENDRLYLTPDARAYYDLKFRTLARPAGPSDEDDIDSPTVETSAPERNPAGYQATDPKGKWHLLDSHWHNDARPYFQRRHQERKRSERAFDETPYRFGFDAAHDPRYAGRSFEEVEPSLRAAWHGSKTWDDLREEIHEGFSYTAVELPRR